jgi:signal transduction histidine kinase
MRKISLQSQITSSFLMVVLLTISLFSVMSYVLIRQRFTTLTFQTGQNFVERNASIFVYYYEANGSWDGLDEFFYTMPRDEFIDKNRPVQKYSWQDRNLIKTDPYSVPPSPDRLILFDVDDLKIFDSDPSEGELFISNEAMKNAIPIVVENVQVGKLISTNSAGLLRHDQAIFIQDIFWKLLASTVISVLTVVVVSLFLTRRILKPVQSLSAASLEIANGDFTQRVDVHEPNELGEMATAFNTMTAELERQNTLRRRATSDIAHELRTPLTVLQIELESLEDGLIEPTTETILGLQREVAYLNHLVEELRVLALAESGDMVLNLVTLDLGALAADIVMRVRHTALEKNISVHLHPPAQQYLVEADEMRVSQILFNLLNNAIQYTPNGGEINVTIEQQDDWVVTSVQDNGMGISEEDLPRVFERLYRANQARTRTNGGSGLGLSIVKGLVTLHHGKISVESEEGKGSRFIFSLPTKWNA